MKNIYRVMRPAWAKSESAETAVIFIASLALAAYAASGERVARIIVEHVGGSETALQMIWPFVDLVVVTVGCVWLLRLYKAHSIRCYPSTYVYAFNMPEASNPDGKSKVVGFCHIHPDEKSGDILVSGASFYWEGGRIGQKTGFRSTMVRGKEDEGRNICSIYFDINEEDQKTRHYSHGILRFELDADASKDAEHDAYVGYLESYQKKGELQNVIVRAWGYAEWYGRNVIGDERLRGDLGKLGARLFSIFDEIKRRPELPSLLRENPLTQPEKANIWKHEIPSPQSVMLNPRLEPYVQKYIRTALGLVKLSEDAITQFLEFAVQKAKTEETMVGYERELKIGLLNDGRRDDKALNERAGIIYSQIKQHLVGETLLDVGCGNGLVASMARGHFKKVLLTDVVEYVPKALNLEFAMHAEGQALPTDGELFDTVLLITVLHHSSNPVELLKLAWGATKRRLIIIESVVGVHSPIAGVRYDLINMANQEPIAFAGFVDWFYNRVLHNGVPVPCNFTTVENWQATFVQNGMRLMQTTHFGQDIEIGPEYHVLFVLQKDPA